MMEAIFRHRALLPYNRADVRSPSNLLSRAWHIKMYDNLKVSVKQQDTFII